MKIDKEQVIGMLLLIFSVILFIAFYAAGVIINVLSAIDEVFVAVLAGMILGGAALIYRGSRHETIAKTPVVFPTTDDTELVRQLRLQNERELRTRRQERYSRLNENVLIPLRDYQGASVQNVINHNPWTNLKFVYNISGIRRNPYFEECVKHLEMDAPNVLASAFDLESKAFNLNNDVDMYNTGVVRSRVRQALEIVIEDQDGIAISENYDNASNRVYLSNIMNVLSNVWINPLLYYRDNDHPIDQSLVNQIPGLRDQLSITSDSDHVVAEGTQLATLPNLDLRTELIAAIRQLQKDVVILQGITNLLATRQQLIRQMNDEVNEPILRITNLIAAERYETVCEFCPS